MDASANGSSRKSAIVGSSSIITCGVKTSSWWSVPKCSATRRACSDSSKLRSPKPIEKVLTAPAGSASTIIATTELESMPPLRNAPSGTSLTRRRRTASRKRLRNSST